MRLREAVHDHDSVAGLYRHGGERRGGCRYKAYCERCRGKDHGRGPPLTSLHVCSQPSLPEPPGQPSPRTCTAHRAPHLAAHPDRRSRPLRTRCSCIDATTAPGDPPLGPGTPVRALQRGPARLDWFKSTCSGSDGGDCVEVAASVDAVHVRDSKDTARPGLRVSRASWAWFVAEVTR
ncbi:DUF397 domain-containing protein [Streptomyces sp. NPDC015127]|uniref:DUF397 domain-containing protein n=1 Tax=Streptomyces sp. NPDC015127 TaxID=3364939 RepID=UPI0036F5E17E